MNQKRDLGSAVSVEPVAYTVPAALAATGIGRTKLYAAIKDGDLRSLRVCGRRLILKDDLLAWLRAARDAT